MKKNLKFYSIMLSLVMFISVFAGSFRAMAAVSSDDLYKSAGTEELTAENDYTTDVTLAIPADDVQIASDVVFVIDVSSSIQDAKTTIYNMLQDLQGQVEATGAQVNVGLVFFGSKLISSRWYDLSTDLATLENDIKVTPTDSGSNLESGLIAAKEMLDGDINVPSDRKYVVVVSDGIIYKFGTDGSRIYIESHSSDDFIDYENNILHPDLQKPMIESSAYSWFRKYVIFKDWVPSIMSSWNWDNYIAQMSAMVPMTLASEYGKTTDNPVPFDSRMDYACGSDVAMYNSYLQFVSMINSGYNCYAIKNAGVFGSNSEYAELLAPIGHSFMDYLAAISGHSGYSFSNIQNDIYSYVGSNSYVVDVIGGSDGNEQIVDSEGNTYNFAFVPGDNGENLSITMDGSEYKVASVEDNKYTFENGSVLTYYAEGSVEGSAEFFRWDFNASFEHISLTYKVKLLDPQVPVNEETTYYVNTNTSATLYPVDSNGATKSPVEFPVPEVHYTVPVAEYELIVNHVNSDGIKLADSTDEVLKALTEYEKSALAINGYQLVGLEIDGEDAELTSSVTDKIQKDTEITFIYEKLYNLKVNYVDESGKTLKESKTGTFLSGTAYSEDAAEIADYELTGLKIDAKDTELAKNVAGNLSADVEITFVYKLVEITPEESSEESSTPPVRPVTPEQSVEGAVEESSTSTPTEEKPVSDKPNTGDQSNVTLWVMGMLISAAGMAIVAKKTRRAHK